MSISAVFGRNFEFSLKRIYGIIEKIKIFDLSFRNDIMWCMSLQCTEGVMLPSSVYTKGMLQGFDEDKYTYETDDVKVARDASCKAAELAMLGLADEANSIVSLVAAHATFEWEHDVRLELFWAESGMDRPAGVAVPFQNAGLTENDRLSAGKKKNEAKRFTIQKAKRKENDRVQESVQSLSRFSEWELTEKSFHEISKIVQQETRGVRDRVTNATCGRLAGFLSRAFTTQLSIALHLDWQERVPELMAVIAHRIHADMQCQCLGTIRAVWRPYLLSGWLRDAIGADLQKLKDYARLVSDTIELRLKNGPLHRTSPYEGWTIRRIVEEIDQNTVRGLQNQSEDSLYLCNAWNFWGVKPSSVKRDPRPLEQILERERLVGHELPADMKEFYRVTDGFILVKCHSNPVSFQVKFVPLDEVGFQSSKDWTTLLSFELISGLTDVVWPTNLAGGIAFWEDEQQYSMYTWVIGPETVARAKASLWKAYKRSGDKRKREIDRKIVHQFGSRKVLDGIEEHCIYEQPWAGHGPSRVHPSFRHYLESVAVRTRDPKAHSPLQRKFIVANDDFCRIHDNYPSGNWRWTPVW